MIQAMPVAELRTAAHAWRTWMAQVACGWPSMTIHDRIDELIDEVERLRRGTGEA